MSVERVHAEQAIGEVNDAMADMSTRLESYRTDISIVHEICLAAENLPSHIFDALKKEDYASIRRIAVLCTYLLSRGISKGIA